MQTSEWLIAAREATHSLSKLATSVDHYNEAKTISLIMNGIK